MEAPENHEPAQPLAVPLERPVRPGLVALVRELERDHGPGGWPAVEMATLTALADEVERLACLVTALEYAEGTAAAAERERWRSAALAGCNGTHPKYAEALRNLVAMLDAGVA